MTAWRWLWAGALCCTACVEQRPEQPGVARAAIVDGEPSGPEDDGVLLTRAALDDQTEVMCTASLVAPNLLITARHCVSYFQDGLFNCTVRGEVVQVSEGAGELGLHLPADSIEVYADETPRDEPIARGVKVLSTLSPVVCVNDIAFVVLDRALELPLLPLRLNRPAQLHEAVTLVGYGMDGQQLTLDYRKQPRLRKSGLEISGRGPDLLEDGVTTVAPRTLLVEGTSGCVGDSGGPLLASETGAVLGVYSLQEGESCNSPDIVHHLTHVPPFQALIDEAFTAAGAEPVPEPDSQGDAGVDAGSAGAAPEPELEPGPEPMGAAGAPSDEEASTPGSSSCALAPSGLTSTPCWWAWALGLATTVERIRRRLGRGSSGRARSSRR